MRITYLADGTAVPVYEPGDLVRLLTLQTGVSSLVEFTVPHDSHVIGRTVGSIDWPEDSTLVAILRDQAPITPSRDDVLDGGDELFFVTTIVRLAGCAVLKQR